ncbi:hypothetical protein V490_05301 [Pseudogymnoascus sp. VKM F-3557]|nr:hypothetical protein V490_05301 [Pseudogymnoascus sp. VKM F-3557]
MTQTVKIIHKPLPTVLYILPPPPLLLPHSRVRMPEINPPSNKQSESQPAELATPDAQDGPTVLTRYHLRVDGAHTGFAAREDLHGYHLAVHALLVGLEVRAWLGLHGVIVVTAGEDESPPCALVEGVADEAVLPCFLPGGAVGEACCVSAARHDAADERIRGVAVAV